MATYRRTTLKQFALGNNAYINTDVTFYTVNLTTGERTSTLATLYNAPSGGSVVSNPYTLDSAGKTAEPLYFETPIVAVINSTELGTHSTGVIYPQSGAYRGEWEASEDYLPGDIVKDGAAGNSTGNLYIAESAHTSTASWASDLGTYWALVVDTAAALAAAELAEEWASNPEDDTVTGGGGLFSSLHYAAKAADSEAAASASASSASTSASTATTQATTATTQAGIATTQAGLAATSAALAEDWAVDNTISGGSAKEWATRAEDSTVPGGGGEFSAKHYAAKAAASAASVANSFGIFAVSGQSNIVADSPGDTLTVAAGTNISITTNATTDTMTISSTLVVGTNVQAYDANLTALASAFTSASASGPATLAFAEDTDNGSNTVTISAPSSVASNKTATLQDVTGTIYVTGGTDVAIADGGTGASDAATARANLGVEYVWSTTFIETVADADYLLNDSFPFSGDIVAVRTISAAGTCTVTSKINTTALGGTANSASTTAQQQTHSSANSIAVGDDLKATVSSNSGCTGLFIMYKIRITAL